MDRGCRIALAIMVLVLTALLGGVAAAALEPDDAARWLAAAVCILGGMRVAASV